MHDTRRGYREKGHVRKAREGSYGKKIQVRSTRGKLTKRRSHKGSSRTEDPEDRVQWLPVVREAEQRTKWRTSSRREGSWCGAF